MQTVTFIKINGTEEKVMYTTDKGVFIEQLRDCNHTLLLKGHEDSVKAELIAGMKAIGWDTKAETKEETVNW